jgi:hypothetical protein
MGLGFDHTHFGPFGWPRSAFGSRPGLIPSALGPNSTLRFLRLPCGAQR